MFGFPPPPPPPPPPGPWRPPGRLYSGTPPRSAGWKITAIGGIIGALLLGIIGTVIAALLYVDLLKHL